MTSVGADATERRAEVATLESAFGTAEPPIAVYGLGKIGTPLAAVLAEEFGTVTGVDIDPAVVSTIESGESHIDGEPGLPALLESVVEDGSLTVTTDGSEAARDARVHLGVVPTLLTENNSPDLSALYAVLDVVGGGLEPGDLVAVESTLPPGTSRDVVAPRLAEISGLDREEFHVAFCPERTASGRAIADITGSYPKVVGGTSPESGRIAKALYERITHNEVIRVADATTAECVKVFEGLYRDVNIALANELARTVEELGVDVNEAIRTANTQPFCDLHTPGAGVGGHCIPVYPYFLTTQVERELHLVETARRVNDDAPVFVAERTLELLDERVDDPSEATVLLLGVAYRAGVAETRFAPATAIAGHLDSAGATVHAVDPVVDVAALDDLDAVPVALDDAIDDARAYDAVVVATAHDEFVEVDFTDFENAAIVDGRQLLRDEPSVDAYVVGSGRSTPSPDE